MCSLNFVSSPPEDDAFIAMLETLQANKSLYFSYSLDLTKRLQLAVSELLAPQTEATSYLRMYPNSMNYVHQFAFNH